MMILIATTYKNSKLRQKPRRDKAVASSGLMLLKRRESGVHFRCTFSKVFKF